MESDKNIWIDASDGDLESVKHYIEEKNYTPNQKDENGYTPIHAAVSYGHVDLLEYLISIGGNINIKDNDGDTPLHSVESLDIAKLLVEKYKADFTIKNNQNESPADKIESEEEYPDIATYLRNLLQNNVNIVDNKENNFIKDANNSNSESVISDIKKTLQNAPNLDSSNIRVEYETSIPKECDSSSQNSQSLNIDSILHSEDPEAKMQQFLQDALRK